MTINNPKNAMSRLKTVSAQAEQTLQAVYHTLDKIDQRQARITHGADRMGATLSQALGRIDTDGSNLAHRLEQIAEAIDLFRSFTNTPPSADASQFHNTSITHAPPTQTTPPNVHVTINTPNAEGIQRSESQITSLLARAVSRGMQGL